ncbi:hypothetical protein SAMN05216228_1006130 [Rhizobium tibeticum]|uniref:Uncharacterized protein n=1 Tax=Rhizobium tibeticum TaxID=501024 RepID=A0A1H8IHN7_9HYPH|nr:hypothetical protein RTCCBAU85039_1917 [Rhizobium tibeticum]SEN67799.1 hypothetical protein SAMN05216228_1006130 [Rhizobium tibeticum]
MSSGEKAGSDPLKMFGQIGNRTGDGALGHKAASGGNDGCMVEAAVSALA